MVLFSRVQPDAMNSIRNECHIRIWYSRLSLAHIDRRHRHYRFGQAHKIHNCVHLWVTSSNTCLSHHAVSWFKVTHDCRAVPHNHPTAFVLEYFPRNYQSRKLDKNKKDSHHEPRNSRSFFNLHCAYEHHTDEWLNNASAATVSRAGFLRH